MTHLSLQLRHSIQEWIRKEIIDFDPYDFEEITLESISSNKILSAQEQTVVLKK